MRPEIRQRLIPIAGSIAAVLVIGLGIGLGIDWLVRGRYIETQTVQAMAEIAQTEAAQELARLDLNP